ncbi:MAG: aminotransferase class I/II-fold pyridoxal phosphate-dependent enzyme, partial [Cytophagia bacterium]|nr:aminotransferase class I/II-fold pyridoxal phosphate-dependent enzyme [Cytophagia bacterium]
SVLNDQDMKELEKLVANRDIIILSDEVYEHIIFDGMKHESISKYPSLIDKSFVISSFGKPIILLVGKWAMFWLLKT